MPAKARTHKPHPPAKRQTAHARGYDAAWQKLRLTVLAREPICRACGRMPSVHVDHVRRHVAGQQHDVDNLQGLCGRCHSIKTVERDGGFGRRRK